MGKTTIMKGDELDKLDIESVVQLALKDALNDLKIFGVNYMVDEWKYLGIPLIDIETKQNTWQDIDQNEPVEFEMDQLHSDINEVREIKENSPFVQTKLKDKDIIVKKSSFCWLLDENNDKVSTYRLKRFIVRKSEHKKISKKTQRKKSSKRILNKKTEKQIKPSSSSTKSSTSTTDDEQVELDDSTDNETFSSELGSDSEPQPKISKVETEIETLEVN
ncbi:unnamed protein product [Brassicogethes aeneus]|uniref:Uncharacterized protein n=1 Tax=Brassicogethes aeneus TaxID=1431903 RepID=A0A9P0B7E5_BRAAE|nr:unnamed protein product [Brassicogethes aeneus]